MFGKVEVRFTEDPVKGYCVYTIVIDGVEVVHLYGGMAALASEVVCRYLETGDNSVRTGDVFERYRKDQGLPEPKAGVIYDDESSS